MAIQLLSITLVFSGSTEKMNVELTQDILKQKTLKPDDTIHAPDPYELSQFRFK